VFASKISSAFIVIFNNMTADAIWLYGYHSHLKPSKSAAEHSSLFHIFIITLLTYMSDCHKWPMYMARNIISEITSTWNEESKATLMNILSQSASASHVGTSLNFIVQNRWVLYYNCITVTPVNLAAHPLSLLSISLLSSLFPGFPSFPLPFISFIPSSFSSLPSL